MGPGMGPDGIGMGSAGRDEVILGIPEDRSNYNFDQVGQPKVLVPHRAERTICKAPHLLQLLQEERMIKGSI
jgi:hypothetical protein